jgi:PA14 domain
MRKDLKIRSRRAQLLVACLAASLCSAQSPLPDDGPRPVFRVEVVESLPPTFGVTAVSTSGLHGQIYFLNDGTLALPNFKKLKPVGSLYTEYLNIPPRDFTDGFPGITNRFEWFAIDYTGRFWIEKPGKYQFALVSDDGSKLYIDNKNVINNDGTHAAVVEYGSVKLTEGIHDIRVSYFQGPRTSLALILAVAGPGEKDFHIFDARKFRPPKGMQDPPAVETGHPK